MSGTPVPAAARIEALQEVLGPGTRVARAVRVGAAPDVAVLDVRLTDGSRLIVKLAGPAGDLDPLRSAAALTAAAGAGVPVPGVVAAGTTPSGLRHLVLEHRDGVPWRDAGPTLTTRDRDALHRDLAGVLVALGRVGFSSFGELDADGHPPGLGLLPALVRRAERIRDVRGRRTFLSLLDREADLFTPPPRPVLVHDDLHPGNLLLRRTPAGWRLAAVLDWDKAWAGPAESDLARLAFWDGMTGPAFWSAVGAPPLDPAADRRRLVHQLLWALEHDAPTARHRADTAALLTRLGIA